MYLSINEKKNDRYTFTFLRNAKNWMQKYIAQIWYLNFCILSNWIPHLVPSVFFFLHKFIHLYLECIMRIAPLTFQRASMSVYELSYTPITFACFCLQANHIIFFFASGCVCEIINSITRLHRMVKIGDLVIVRLAVSFKGHALGNLTYRLPQTYFGIIFSLAPLTIAVSVTHLSSVVYYENSIIATSFNCVYAAFNP